MQFFHAGEVGAVSPLYVNENRPVWWPLEIPFMSPNHPPSTGIYTCMCACMNLKYNPVQVQYVVSYTYIIQPCCG